MYYSLEEAYADLYNKHDTSCLLRKNYNFIDELNNSSYNKYDEYRKKILNKPCVGIDEFRKIILINPLLGVNNNKIFNHLNNCTSCRFYLKNKTTKIKSPFNIIRVIWVFIKKLFYKPFKMFSWF